MVEHLETNNLHNDPQHRFNLNSMVRYYDSLLTLLEHGHALDAIYLDFFEGFRQS